MRPGEFSLAQGTVRQCPWNRIPGLDRSTALEATRIYSVAGLPLPPGALIEEPPFRAPHHGASPVAVIGGGTTWMRPGEFSLAQGTVRQCPWNRMVPSRIRGQGLGGLTAPHCMWKCHPWCTTRQAFPNPWT